MTPDLSYLKEQQKLLHHTPSLPPVQPLQTVENIGSKKQQAIGQKLIHEGKVGVILLAGGQGTRLRFNGPKGLYPIGIFSKKTVFQRFYERIQGAEAQSGRSLPVAIMTSPENDTITRSYFETLKATVSFFTQATLPFLDEQGELFLNPEGTLAQGPDGNGDCLKQFVKSGLCQEWEEKGVIAIQVILVDNLLADPFDPEMVGSLVEHHADVVLKCTERSHAKEKMGLLVTEKGKIAVREYSEMPLQEMEETDAQGKLKYAYANLSTFCFSLSFVKNSPSFSLPLHLAHKALPSLMDPSPKKPNGWKFERFLFDLLPFANSVIPLFSPRFLCYAPLKNHAGEHSPEEVQQMVQTFDRYIIEQITSLPPPNHPFELSPLFYYPTNEILLKWKGKEISKTEALIEP